MPFSTNTTTSEYSGTAMAFAFKSSYTGATLTGAGFLGRTIASADAEPEVFQTAVNGDGQVEAIAISTSANKMLKVQLTGYVDVTFNKLTLPNKFSDGAGPLAGRTFFIKKISEPVPKGAFVEVSLDLESYPLITS